MLERARLAARRLLTMANLFENLREIYGDREAFTLAEPLGYRLFPSARLAYGDCLRFTSLAAEAFIRVLDLKKGERVILCVPEPAESLLVTAALIKAGGIAVPVDYGLPASDLARRVQECGATLAVVDGGVLAERPDLAGCMPGIERAVVSGERSRTPEGVPSLDEAMEASEGFFLPYTLKPSNVVCLFHTEMGDGSLKAIMATNQGLLGPHRWAMPFLPARAGGGCICTVSPSSMAGFSAAVLALCMGLGLRFLPGNEPGEIMDAMEEGRPTAFFGSQEIFDSLSRAGFSRRDLPSVRLWFSAGGDPTGGLAEAAKNPLLRCGPGPSACFVSAYGAGGNATILALKPAATVFTWPEGCPGFVIPPNRAVVVDGMGRRQRRGREGELAIKGPSVTPGYWNDIEGTLEAKRGGWFHTGIKATKRRFFITLG